MRTPIRILTTMTVMLAALPLTAADPAGYSLDRLTCMSPCELEQLYRSAVPGAIPDGYLRGKAIYCPDTFLAGPRGKVTNFLWRGKVFCGDTLVNQWRGVRAMHARVYYGPSSLDGRPAIILDYCGMSHVWRDVRDEIREVCPGVYLGRMYRRACPEPKFQMFFALVPCDAP
jgi:hypothetical protein